MLKTIYNCFNIFLKSQYRNNFNMYKQIIALTCEKKSKVEKRSIRCHILR